MNQYGYGHRRTVSESRGGGYYRQEQKKKGGGKFFFAAFIMIAALVAGLYIYLSSSFIYIAGKIIGVDETQVDLRGRGVSDIAELEKLKNLTLLDVRDNPITKENFEKLSEDHPNCEILWSVPFSSGSIDCTSTDIVLGNASAEDLAALDYMTSLKSCDLSGCVLYDELMVLREKYSDVDFLWTIRICGNEYRSDTKNIVLSASAGPQDVSSLMYLPELESVDASGCTCYDELIAIYKAKNGQCDMLWEIELAGINVKSTDTRLDISNTEIDDFDGFLKKINFLPKLEYIDMCECGLSNEQMEQLCNTYPQTKFVWIVHFGRWSLRTDATIFSTLQYDPPKDPLTSADIEVLKYCTDLEMLDLGHNAITDISCLSGLTKMKVLILADNRISDITPIASMTDLFYLEMFINRVSDISVLENMPKLRQVNFCWNYRISDPTVLYDKPLEKVWMCGTAMSAQTKKEFKKALPDCEFDFHSTWGSTNGSWRTNETYYKIKDAFKNRSGTSEHIWDE